MFNFKQLFTKAIQDGALLYRKVKDDTALEVVGMKGNDSEIKIPAFVMDLPVVGIGDEAFLKNSKIKKVDMPGTLRYIGARAFMGCSALKGVNAPLRVEGEGKVQDEEVSSDGFIGEEAFKDCANLTIFSLTRYIGKIGEGAFWACKNLQHFFFHEEGNFRVIENDAFRGCEELKISLPQSLLSIGDYAFYGCAEIRDLAIPPKVFEIGTLAFQGCTFGRILLIPESVTTMGRDVFCDCKNTVIHCAIDKKPQNWADSWNDANLPVAWGNDLTSFLEQGLSFVLSEDGSYYSVKANANAVGKKICIPMEYHGLPVRGILPYGFMECKNLESIRISSEGLFVRYDIGQGAFCGCENLVSVELPDYALSEIPAQAFMNCTSLREIRLPVDIYTVKKGAFYGCSSLEKVEIASYRTLEDEAFAYCENLTEFSYADEYLKKYPNAFKRCKRLKP